MNINNPCPCGSTVDYLPCCGKYIEQGELPTSAEALMRSRYTAYTLANIDYIEQTMQGKAAHNFDANAAREFAKQADWQSLTIKSCEQGGDIGKVEFIARYCLDGALHFMLECSEFRRIDGRWLYTFGISLASKLGRNENCLCGSGRKYKKCCQSH
jgi:SEC-C motif-containing protein